MSVKKTDWVSRSFLFLGLAAIAAMLAVIWPRADYYFLSSILRPLHPAHESLRPSGRGGLFFASLGPSLSFLI